MNLSQHCKGIPGYAELQKRTACSGKEERRQVFGSTTSPAQCSRYRSEYEVARTFPSSDQYELKQFKRSSSSSAAPGIEKMIFSTASDCTAV
jgi:hypothetical protein